MNLQEQKTRTILLIAAAILFALFIMGSCVFDAGVALQLGKFSQCIYPPHVCTQP